MDTRTATFDVVVIGAGPVGENVADQVVQGGLSAAAAAAAAAEAMFGSSAAARAAPTSG